MPDATRRPIEKESSPRGGMLSPDTSVRALPGVGQVRAAAYARLGIFTLGDLLHHYPRAYENRGDIHSLFEAAMTGEKCALLLTVGTEPRCTTVRRGMSLLKFRAYDESGTAEITFFNQPYLRDKFPLGAEFRFYGRVERTGKRFALSSPVCEPWNEASPPPALVPVYRMTEGLNGKQLSAAVLTALSLVGDTIEDPVPGELLARHGLCSLSEALRSIHFPDDYRALAVAKKRLIYDEFFHFSVGMSMTKRLDRPHGAPICSDTSLDAFLASLPYRLTPDQRNAVGEILCDMQKDVPMNRMLVGDVGCGKTVCAAAAMYVAVKNGRQAVLMAPTEILARQHFADLSALFGRMGIPCALLIGATPAAQKKKIRQALIAAEPSERLPVVIGTQALLSDGVDFAAPGLVVTDEQHRFGVGQRAALAGKNARAHLLVMSATPIPRSMALILYGDLDISRIRTMPPGRQRVDTFAVDESYRPRLEAFIEKQVNAGGQVYIVCPAVEEPEEEEAGYGALSLSDISSDGSIRRDGRTPLKTAVEFSEKLAARFPQFHVAFLHGRMKSAEKESVMQEFTEGRVQILVSTTVIEVGVNVPNACLMIVENADRFGLSQLHQLRGRVGRGTRKSYCVLVSDAAAKGNTSPSVQRLHALCTLYDGYAIAEQDLALRGPGDFFRTGAADSIRQSGGLRLRLAELCDDPSLFTEAVADAAALVSSDPSLAAHPLLRRSVERLFALEAGTMN